jgi:26S proteasome regulatory subunit N7
MIRDFKNAARLFLDAVATFNSPELISFKDLVLYTVISSLITLERAEIKKKVPPSIAISLSKHISYHLT